MSLREKMDQPTKDKLDDSGADETKRENSLKSSAVYRCREAFQQNMYMLGIFYVHSSLLSYMWRDVLKRKNSLLFIAIALIFTTANVSLLNIRYPRNIGLNILLILLLLVSMLTGCSCVPENDITVVLYISVNVAFVCSTMSFPTQKLTFSSRYHGLLAATVSIFYSTLLYCLRHLQKETQQSIYLISSRLQIVISILGLILQTLSNLKKLHLPLIFQDLFMYIGPFFMNIAASKYLLEDMNLQADFRFIVPLCTSTVLSVCTIMGGYNLNHRDFKKFERLLVNPKLVLLTGSLFAITFGAYCISSQAGYFF